MNLNQLKIYFNEQLAREYPKTEIHSFFYLLTADYLKMDRLQVALNPQKNINESELVAFDRALQQLHAHRPIQYILEKTRFFGLDFKVNPNVLIPRPETEALVAWVLEDVRKNPPFSQCKILDIGTGSGCIAVSIAKNLPSASVFALDISNQALKTAKQNANQNNVKVNFERADILKMETLPRNFDIIVSNPPYVRQLEKASMDRNVLEHEPTLALYVEDDDALVFYRKIAELAKTNLAKNGAVYVECNQYLAEESGAVFRKKGFKTELQKDIFKNDRMLKCVLPS